MINAIFGDSFIGPFTLLKDKSLYIYKYKGASLKGITKDDNKNRKHIEFVLNKYKYNCVLFNFGQVDINFSFFYDEYVQKKDFDYKTAIEEYVKFIKNLDCQGCTKAIINVFPIAIKEGDFIKSLKAYKIIESDDIPANIIKKYNYEYRWKLYLEYSSYLKQMCIKYGVYFIDMNKDLVWGKKVKKDFVNPVSFYNIHLNWEPLIPLIEKYFQGCGIKNYSKENNFNKYIENKAKEIDEIKKDEKGYYIKKTKDKIKIVENNIEKYGEDYLNELKQKLSKFEKMSTGRRLLYIQ